MTNKVKKVAAILLLTVSLCGTVLTVHAAEHVHDSYETFAGTIRSVNSTHQYVTAVNHDKNGNIVGYQYGTCTVTTSLNQYNYVCHICGQVTGSTTRTVTSHSVSH